MSRKPHRFIVLTGSPGTGKTTLVKKVCHELKEKNFKIKGFFTEEVRSGRERIGFDVILLTGERAPLAKINSAGDYSNKPFVGKYAVDLKSFESCVLPVLNQIDSKSILVLDEIGKMELLSTKFKEFVSKSISTGNSVIFATIPVTGMRQNPLIELLRNHAETRLFTVTRENRNNLEGIVLKSVMDATAE